MLTRSKTQTPLDIETNHAIEALSHHRRDSEEYGVILGRVEKLHAMRLEEKSNAKVSPETKATIAANLVGIAMILNFERANIVTSKAIGFILRVQ